MQRAWLIGGILVVVLLAVVAGPWRLGLRAPARPNVLLLSIDTLRADHLGCYGGTRVATPNIDRIAAEGALFENAACPMPMTRPSLSTVHTSLHPREHGVVNNGVALAPDAVTLAEVLAGAGYATAAFTPVRLLDAASGLAQGFATYDAPRRASRAGRPRRAAGARLARGARPGAAVLRLAAPLRPAPAVRATARSTCRARARARCRGGACSRPRNANDGDVPASVLERALELYAGEVAYVDHWVGEVLAKLDALGVLDDTIVVFTADHGECFDHGIFFEHSDCLYDGAAKVPLLVRYPASGRGGHARRRAGRAPRRRTDDPRARRRRGTAGVPRPRAAARPAARAGRVRARGVRADRAPALPGPERRRAQPQAGAHPLGRRHADARDRRRPPEQRRARLDVEAHHRRPRERAVRPARGSRRGARPRDARSPRSPPSCAACSRRSRRSTRSACARTAT